MPRNIRLSSPIASYLLRLGDGLVIFISGLLALNIRKVLNLPIEFPVNLSGYYSLIAVGALLFATLSGSVYRSWRGAVMPAMLARITGKWLLVVSIILLWLFIFKTLYKQLIQLLSIKIGVFRKENAVFLPDGQYLAGRVSNNLFFLFTGLTV